MSCFQSDDPSDVPQVLIRNLTTPLGRFEDVVVTCVPGTPEPSGPLAMYVNDEQSYWQVRQYMTGLVDYPAAPSFLEELGIAANI